MGRFHLSFLEGSGSRSCRRMTAVVVTVVAVPAAAVKVSIEMVSLTVVVISQSSDTEEPFKQRRGGCLLKVRCERIV